MAKKNGSALLQFVRGDDDRKGLTEASGRGHSVIDSAPAFLQRVADLALARHCECAFAEQAELLLVVIEKRRCELEIGHKPTVLGVFRLPRIRSRKDGCTVIINCG